MPVKSALKARIREAHPAITLARQEGLYIGIASHALALFNARGSSFTQTLTEYAATFPSIELKFTLPSLPSESVLRSVTEHTQLHFLWHFKALDLSLDEHHALPFFARPEWLAVVTALLEQAPERCTVILSLDRSIEYSEVLAATLEELAETMQPLCLAFEFEHGSWKKSEKLFAAVHVPILELDAPRLPGLIRPIRSTHKRIAILRLVGHNAKTWLKHQDEERFLYDYTNEEITVLTRRILALKDLSDNVFVTCASYPAASAHACAQRIAEAFVRQRIAETSLSA